MSNSIGSNLVNQRLLEHHTRINTSPCVSSGNYTLFRLQDTSRLRKLPLSLQDTSRLRKLPLSTQFRSNVVRRRLLMNSNRLASVMPRVVLATDSPSELAEKFILEGNTELQVSIRGPGPDCSSQIELQVTNSSDNLVFHWGGIRDKNGKWVLPSRHPDGTKEYKNRALRTPFVKSGSNSFLRLEIDDPALQAIEFLIFDDAQNKWFKHKGDNFHIKLPSTEKLSPNVLVPEDLVQIQAYLRWERNGKQTYTPEQEKEEYEAARTELLEEVSRGISIQDLQARLKKSNVNESKGPLLSEKISQVPDDLVQIQAYVRWEKAGNPNYSSDQQLVNFSSHTWL